MALGRGKWRGWISLRSTVISLFAIVVWSSSKILVSARCTVVQDFNLCSCYSIGNQVGVDCNSVPIENITAALRESDEIRRRTVRL